MLVSGYWWGIINAKRVCPKNELLWIFIIWHGPPPPPPQPVHELGRQGPAPHPSRRPELYPSEVLPRDCHDGRPISKTPQTQWNYFQHESKWRQSAGGPGYKHLWEQVQGERKEWRQGPDDEETGRDWYRVQGLRRAEWGSKFKTKIRNFEKQDIRERLGRTLKWLEPSWKN